MTETITVKYRGYNAKVPIESYVKERVENLIISKEYTTADFPYTLYRKEKKLQQWVECHAIAKFGTRSTNKLFESWGWQAKRKKTPKEWFEILQKVVTDKVAKKVYEERKIQKDGKLQEFFFNLGKEGRSIYHFYRKTYQDPNSKSYDFKKFERDINKLHPDLQAVYGIKLYDVLTYAPPTHTELAARITELYYQKENVESRRGLGLIKPDGERLASTIYFGNSKKHYDGAIGDKEKLFLKKVFPYIKTPLKLKDFSATRAQINTVGTLAELELVFLLHTLHKYDPELSTIDASIREFFPSPLNHIYKRTEDELTVARSSSHHTGHRFDLHVQADGLEILVETKSGVITGKTVKEKIIQRYTEPHLQNGTPIHKKIVFLNTDKIAYHKGLKMLKDEQYQIITEDIFRTWYKQGLELLMANNPTIFTQKITHSPQLLLELHNTIAHTSHILMRRVHEQWCMWAKHLLRQDIALLLRDTPLQSPPTQEIKPLIIPLREFNEFYRKEDLEILHNLSVKGKAFYDSETTGFNMGGSMIGVAGLITEINNIPSLIMYTINNPFDEIQLLKDMALLVQGKRIFTFNGRTFDIPLTERRYAAHCLPSPFSGDNIDYLATFSNHAHKNYYPAAGQIEFERANLGVSRKEDIPGKDIPKVVLNHINGRHEPRMIKVKKHCKLDVITLALMDQFFLRQGLAPY